MSIPVNIAVATGALINISYKCLGLSKALGMFPAAPGVEDFILKNIFEFLTAKVFDFGYAVCYRFLYVRTNSDTAVDFPVQKIIFAEMTQLRTLNNYFRRYRFLLLLGVLFVILTNYFRILSPQLTGYVVNSVVAVIKPGTNAAEASAMRNYDILVVQIIHWFNNKPLQSRILFAGIILLIIALISGFFMFLMRQTIIVMSRHIEFDQKNEIFAHYQKLDTNFYKTHSTGDLMSRISEDVSRVRL